MVRWHNTRTSTRPRSFAKGGRNDKCAFRQFFAITFLFTVTSAGSQAQPLPTITKFPVPTINATPNGIVGGPDGNVWFTELSGNKIGRITPQGLMTEFEIPTAQSQPFGIAAGADGNLWFTERLSGKIGRITPDGVITEFTLPTAGSFPQGITPGGFADLYVAETNARKIAVIPLAVPFDPTDIVELSTGFASPVDLVLGADGNVWFTAGNQIGRMMLDGTLTLYDIPLGGAGAQGIAAGPDGNVWFAAPGRDRLGRITPDGTITLFDPPPCDCAAYDITSGPDGNLWYTRTLAAGRIGRITPSGSFTERAGVNTPRDIATGPDGNMWFAEGAGNIGRVSLVAAPMATATPTPTATRTASPALTHTPTTMPTATSTGTRTPPPTLSITPTPRPTSTPTVTPTQQVTFPGDANCNSRLDADDAAATVTAVFDPVARALCDADCNQDDAVTATDMTCVVKVLAGPQP